MTTSYADANPAIESPSARVKPWPWERIGLALLLLGTAVSFLWGLDRNGWANPYYSAAAQAGSQDWKAFFFGSLDAGNLITIDKPPLSIWIMALSVRLFGLNSWAILVPQALMGIATTWLIYKIIRRSYPAAPALLGGLIYATTPVVVLMSRYNNPEPLMGLLTVSAVYFIVRAIEDNRWTWYLFSGTALGLAFMAKQIQAFLPVPAMVVAVLLLGAGTIGSRLIRLLGSLVSLILSGGWWIAIVELTPKTNRPYIGGSATNSILELTLDYNGFARFIRLPAESSGTAPANQAVATYDGGWSRLFNGNFAPESGWLLATALLSLLVVMILRKVAPQRTGSRALLLVSGAWFLTVYIVLSFMGTMIHSYYVYSLGAPLALTIGPIIFILREKSSHLPVRLIGATIIAATAYVSIRVFDYGQGWPPWLVPTAISLGLIATLAWLIIPKTKICVAVVLVSMTYGPVATNIYTIATTQGGTNPVSGPISSDPRAISRHLENARAGKPAWALQIAYGTQPSSVVSQLLRDADREVIWPAATYSAQNAARYQLSTGRPVLAVGGWLGTDPAPTLEQFKALVADGKISYFIWQQDLLDLGGLGPEAVAITKWIESSYPETSVDGVRLYDLRR